jgi:hypothetical protein
MCALVFGVRVVIACISTVREGTCGPHEREVARALVSKERKKGREFVTPLLLEGLHPTELGSRLGSDSSRNSLSRTHPLLC